MRISASLAAQERHTQGLREAPARHVHEHADRINTDLLAFIKG
jgi:hypothetical protein